MLSCKKCKNLWINDQTDEAYCSLIGERIRLKKGQWRPSWCPVQNCSNCDRAYDFTCSGAMAEKCFGEW